MSILLWVMLAVMTVIGYFCNSAIGNNVLIGNFLVSVMLILTWGYYVAVGIKSRYVYRITLGYFLLVFVAVMIRLVLYFEGKNSILWTVCEVFITPFQGIRYVVSSAAEFYWDIGLAALTGIVASIYKLRIKKKI